MSYATLGLGNETSLITGMTMIDLGQDLTLSCLYDPMGKRLPYQLVCKNCKAMQWESIDREIVVEPPADLIGIVIDVQDGYTTAVITTDCFELSIVCEQLEVDKDW